MKKQSTKTLTKTTHKIKIKKLKTLKSKNHTKKTKLVFELLI